MKKLFKYLLIGVVVIVVLFMIPIGIFLGIDLNNYKQEITDAVQSATGRQLQLKGELSKSVFPWLGVEVGSTALGNAVGFQPNDFASVERVQIKIALLPLLQKKITIDNIVLHGLVVNLAKNKKGVSNWDDLTATATAKTATEAPAPATPPATAPASETTVPEIELLSALTIGGVDIRDAQLRWDDQQAGAIYEIRNLNLKTSAVQLDQPVMLALSLDASANQPKMKTHLDWQGKLTLDLKSQQYRMSDMLIALAAEGDMLPAKTLTTKISGNIDADLAKQQVNISQLVLEALGLKFTAQMKATNILDKPGLTGHVAIADFNPRAMMKTLAIALPPMADAEALTQMSLSLDLKGGLDAASIHNLKLALDQTQLTGSASLTHFTKPAITYDLNLDAIDVDRYLPPPVETPAAASNPAASAPASATAEKASPPAAVELPVALIRSLDINGTLKIGKVMASHIPAENIVVSGKAKDGQVSIKPLSAKLAEGNINSAVELDVTGKTPVYKVNAQLEKVHFGPIVKAIMKDELVKGVASIKADITTQGSLIDDLQKQLNGTASFNVGNGEVKYLDLADLLVAKYAKYLRQAGPADKPTEVTAFKTLTGSATINNGIVTNKDLLMVSSRFEVKGVGSVSLPGQSLDYRLAVKIINPTEGMKKIGLDKLGDDVITATLKGPFTAIEQDVDYTSILKKTVKKQAQQKIETKREERKEEVKQEVQEKKEELREKAKEKLKNLFRR